MQIGFEPDVLVEYNKLASLEANLKSQVEEMITMYSATKSVVEKYRDELQAKRAEAEAKKAEKAEAVAKLKEQLSQMTLDLDQTIIAGIEVRRQAEPEFGKVVDDDYLESLEMPVKVKLLTTDVSEIERIKSLDAIIVDMKSAKPSWKTANEFRGRICEVRDEIKDAGVTKPGASLQKQLRAVWKAFDAFKERCPAENNLQRELKKINGGKKNDKRN